MTGGSVTFAKKNNIALVCNSFLALFPIKFSQQYVKCSEFLRQGSVLFSKIAPFRLSFAASKWSTKYSSRRTKNQWLANGCLIGNRHSVSAAVINHTLLSLLCHFLFFFSDRLPCQKIPRGRCTTNKLPEKKAETSMAAATK